MSLEHIFGTGDQLDPFQMGARALVLFAITLLLVRIGGMRAFGRKSSFDTILVIMLGAVLSRAVVGASPFGSTIAAATVLVVVHRVLAIATARFPRLERIIKGEHHALYRDGKLDRGAMLRAGISAADVEEAVRSSLHRSRVLEVAQVELESSGQISVIDRR